MKQPEAMTERTASARVHRRPSVRTARWLAWSLWALSVVLVALSGVFAGLELLRRRRLLHTGSLTSSLLPRSSWCTCRLPATNELHRLAVRRVWALSTRSWYSPASTVRMRSSLMLAVARRGRGEIGFARGLLPAANLFLYSFLLFPDGRFASSLARRGPARRTHDLLEPRYRSRSHRDRLDNFLRREPVRLREGRRSAGFVETLSIPFLVATLLAPVAALFVLSSRRARGEERQQIKWSPLPRRYCRPL